MTPLIFSTVVVILFFGLLWHDHSASDCSEERLATPTGERINRNRGTKQGRYMGLGALPFSIPIEQTKATEGSTNGMALSRGVQSVLQFFMLFIQLAWIGFCCTCVASIATTSIAGI